MIYGGGWLDDEDNENNDAKYAGAMRKVFRITVMIPFQDQLLISPKIRQLYQERCNLLLLVRICVSKVASSQTYLSTTLQLPPITTFKDINGTQFLSQTLALFPTLNQNNKTTHNNPIVKSPWIFAFN